jgi:hypothetical protein
LIEVVNRVLLREREAAGARYGTGELWGTTNMSIRCRTEQAEGIRRCTGGWEEDREKEED